MWKRLQNIFKGFMSLFIKGLETSNPKALLEAERESLREKVAKFNQSLAKQAGFVARLERLIAEGDKREKELAAKFQANVAAGNTEIAGRLATDYKTVKDQVAGYREQLKANKKTYEDLVKAKEVTIREAKMKLDELARKLSQVEMKEAEAELREMSQAMVSEIGSDGDTISRLEDSLNERLEYATGRAEVAKHSSDTTEITMKESERKALEQQAMMELAASMGLEVPGMVKPAAAEPLGEASSPQKSIGPVSLEKELS